MTQNIFSSYASTPENPHWQEHIERKTPLYQRKNDIRSDYERDYTRILHSLAYRRLKHKTQVFFNIDNDHICTRMEHVQHVESVSCTIAKYLGLNVDLTRAIAMGHDLGHAPFGYDGEVDENGIIPRKERIVLDEFSTSGQYQAYTWEGCVVKIADKIAYLGRDIEDAIRMNFIEEKDKQELRDISRLYGEKTINTTIIIHNFITSICDNSSPEAGIRLSDEDNKMLNQIKDFNYDTIYKNAKFNVYKNYAALVIRSIYNTLIDLYDCDNTLNKLSEKESTYPTLIDDFAKHIKVYSELENNERYKNKKIYGKLEDKKIYAQAIIDYISGMTDRYAIEIFNELLRH